MEGIAVPWLYFVTVLLFEDTVAGEVCYSSLYHSAYCHFGCCRNSYGSVVCCPTVVPVIAIIISVLACLVPVIAVVIICCCKRKTGPGHVIRQPGQTSQPGDISSYEQTPSQAEETSSYGQTLPLPGQTWYEQTTEQAEQATEMPSTAGNPPPYTCQIRSEAKPGVVYQGRYLYSTNYRTFHSYEAQNGEVLTTFRPDGTDLQQASTLRNSYSSQQASTLRNSYSSQHSPYIHPPGASGYDDYATPPPPEYPGQ